MKKIFSIIVLAFIFFSLYLIYLQDGIIAVFVAMFLYAIVGVVALDFISRFFKKY